MNARSGPHQGQPVATSGRPLHSARAAMLMMHGRGASAEDILSLSRELPHPHFAYIAPQAAGGTWYPNSFMAPLASNEPGLSSALQVIADLLTMLQKAGIPAERTVLLGFSQGACLTLEFVARNPGRYGAVAALSGALIGPDGTPRTHGSETASATGKLDGTSIFLGCSDVDFHIPKARVQQSAAVLRALGSMVTERLYPGMGHTVNQDELDFVRSLMQGVAGA